jgi:hypothetical protein
MKLEFDNLTELEQFLMFSAHIGKQLHVAPQTNVSMHVTRAPDNLATEMAALDRAMSGAIDAGDGAHDTIEEDDTANQVDIAPKRKRRTKAEIEAERAGKIAAAPAEAAQPDTSASTIVEYVVAEQTQGGADAQRQEAQETAPRGNPFAVSPSTQAILEATEQSAATLAGMAAMQAEAPAEQVEASGGRDARVAAILAEGALTDSLAHLKRCQAFIQKHGMAKYNESFSEGLTANIAVYTPEQCALHVALLEELEA